jgi:hypothetical protein
VPAHDPTERALLARIAADTRWATVDDRTAATAPAREAAEGRWERQVDPDGALDPAERARRAESLKRAHFTRLALKSARSRRQAAELTAEAEAAETELSGLGEAI